MRKWISDGPSDAEAVVLGITNSSSMGWAASQLETDKLGVQQQRADQHHLYFVVAGPRLTPVALSEDLDTGGWNLDIVHTTAEVRGSVSVQVPRAAFPGYSLALAKGVLSIVTDADADADGLPGREVTPAEVVRAALRAHSAAAETKPLRHFPAPHIRYELVDDVLTLVSVEEPTDDPVAGETDPVQDYINQIVDALFIFDVIYIGKSYGTEGSRTAIDRIFGHEKAQPALAYVHDYRPYESLGFVTINQQMNSVDKLNIDTSEGYPDTKSLSEWLVHHVGVLNEPLTETTVDAAESVLIGAFKPPRNESKINFSSRTVSVRKLRELGYTHLQVRIDLQDSYAKLRGPNKRASTNHNLTFNLITGEMESPGDTSWNEFSTGH